MKESIWYRFDWWLLAAAVLLSGMGLISIFSTTQSAFWTLLDRRFLGQLIYLFFGVIACLIVANYEYRKLRAYIYPLFLLSLLVLVGVALFGSVHNGSRAWFDLGVLSIQPAEFAKPIFILTLATFLGRRRHHSVASILQAGLFLVPLIGLIMLQPDFGTATVFLAIWIFVMLGVKLPGRQKLLLVILGLLLTVLAVSAAIILLPDGHFQKQRLLVYPEQLLLEGKRHLDIGYQVDQSLIAIGSGGFWGKGIGAGSQSQLGFIPAAQTDFIFAALAEEMGFIGIAIFLLLFIFLLIRILHIASGAQDEFGRIIVFGVFGLIFFHAIQAIGMTLGLVPVTGIPLVLVSYGGSSLLTTYISLGLTESVKIRYKKAL
ncbi:MAG: hypothetical protein A2788_01210 [Candidatus Abawacabacteria bacterium RIFCSPHIGHO2_01_FULL_46_8]|uniref:Rod shape-determining protein RodA n=1 Tax=Candidatus Abawacabacteria bacterium RIFCSPHIGHO2_01_FULL_46_8 TaxID=1817815 RepID=A0A1F4XK99_9BACT|nr:MAG: hypothetical protein A2788_01210 [Candidatus Abawacabacteria bacterium RIFCSPHIGHO2_01_FULL_46_8]